MKLGVAEIAAIWLGWWRWAWVPDVRIQKIATKFCRHMRSETQWVFRWSRPEPSFVFITTHGNNPKARLPVIPDSSD